MMPETSKSRYLCKKAVQFEWCYRELMSRLGSTRKTIDESTQIEIEKYSEKFQISKNFDFWKHFFILYQIKISLQFFCFFLKKIRHLFLGSDQMLNPQNCSRFGIRNILNHRFSSRSGSTHRFSSPPFDPQ